MPLTPDKWQKAKHIYLEHPDTGHTLYECHGFQRDNLMYFLADFVYKKPVRMVVTDEQGYVLGVDEMPRVTGKFGPGVIIRKQGACTND